ncbi:NB-ARC domain disease resistance protein [Medicago truncatula]|uniref:NB-ARC domain disease resistance protein n=1 Tax=Medicago truncatula TaxID=3880 RepID=G7K9C9_MEDTR|nr:NB-ARC domain disease resistance protein [Medicago truncatula]
MSVIVLLEIERGVREVLTHVKENHVNQIRGLCGAPEEPVCMGMDEPLNKLKIELMKDGVSVLFLTGLGGSGKNHSCQEALSTNPLIKDKFGGNIFFVTFSKTPNVSYIVQRLFEQCGHGLQVPDFQSNEDAINQLGHLLSQFERSKILLVLDDVWPGSENLVEKFKFQLPDYKILVTSRVGFRRFDTLCQLGALDHHSAWTLFRHFAQLNHNSSFMPDKNLVDVIVTACKGLPLALEVISGTLRNQPFETWQNMKERLTCQSILESNRKDLLCLQQSFDISEDIDKECFMDMGLFPEDQRIPVTVLIDMWAAMAIVHDSITRNLIDVIATRKVATGTDTYYNNHYVMQHDLLRDLAIHQSKGEPFEQRKRMIIDLNGDTRPDWWIGLIVANWMRKHTNNKLDV